jgi:outer membrane protein OmpA-like peptidoglycan-associated protein
MLRAMLALLLLLGDPISFQLKNDVPVGQKPTLTVQAVDRVRDLKIELDGGGAHVSLAQPALGPGDRASFPIGDGNAGKTHWKGKISAFIVGGGGPWSYELEFDTLVRASVTIGYDFEHLDLANHVLGFQLSRPAAKAELEVIGEDGKPLGTGEASYRGEAAGTWLQIPWTQRAGNILAMRLRATTNDGLQAAVELVPWQVTIEHEDVNFDTDSAMVKPSEAGKLDASLRKIEDAVHRAEKFVKVKLYVAGHTDTVGTKDHNRKLSLDRARSIADYFRRHGLKIPIAFEGFGEDVLKVQTPDEKDEPRNRRADYVLAAASAPPPASLAGKRAVHANWKALP